MANILIVEDEENIATNIKLCLKNSGYTVIAVTAYGEKAIELAAELHPDLVLMDVMLKGNMDGVQAAAQMRSRFNIPVIYLTACSDPNTLERAKNTEPFGYIIKPFEERQLITTIEIALGRHQVETAIFRSLKREKELGELKSQFVSMLSHEFRNPLTRILTSTHLLEHYKHQLNEKKKLKYLHHIKASVKQLNQLLNDILVVGKAEAVRLQFNPVLLELKKFCHDLVEEMQLCAGNKHSITFASLGDCTQACLDEKLLWHILSNLLSNAIKYSPQGGTICFDLVCEQGKAIFRIQDSGIGIPASDREDLFNCFHRGSNVGNLPGSGLGLVIVKQYVELHGGEIGFASQVGVGTTFIVTLPLTQQISTDEKDTNLLSTRYTLAASVASAEGEALALARGIR